MTIRIVRPVGSGLIAPIPPGPGVYSETISDTVGVLSALTSSVVSADTGVLDYTNRPSGLTTRTDARWGESSTAYPSSWAANAPNHGGTVGIVNNNTASPTGGSLNVMFPAGMAPGLQTTTVYYLGVPSGATEVFLGTTDRYRAPWQMMSQHVKLDLFQCPTTAVTNGFIGIFDGNNSRASGPFTFWGGGTGQETVSASGITLDSSTWDNNVTVVDPLDPDAGKWYKRELYLRRSTNSTSADGIVRMWVDGTLVLDVTNVNYAAGFSFGEFQHAGTWGGSGIAVIANQTWEIARTLIATD